MSGPLIAFEPATTGSSLARDSHSLDHLYVDALSAKGQRARGLYFNGPIAKRLGAPGIVRMLTGAGLDAAVIDVKDGEGRVFYDTKIEVLQAQKRQVFIDTAFIDKLKASGVYTIARVVCFSDPKLPRNYPDRAIMDGRPGKLGQIWANWGRRNPWLDPYNKANGDLVVSMATELEALGFDEIQLDYFRFPVDEATAFALFPAQDDRPRQEVLLDILRRVDIAIDIPIGVDVFGVTAFHTGDPDGLGQVLEDWATHVEVFSPMLYINSMRKWLIDQKEQRAMRLVQGGVSKLRRRLGHGPVIRPFLQAYSQGSDHYSPEFIAEQIVAARQGGADGFLFWHPDSNYGMVRAAAAGPARGIGPFPIEKRIEWRRQAYGERPPPTARADQDNSGEPPADDPKI